MTATQQRQAALETGRAYTCAHLAQTLFPDSIGDQLWRDLTDWAQDGWRYDRCGRGLALMDDLEKRGHAKALGRSYP